MEIFGLKIKKKVKFPVLIRENKPQKLAKIKDETVSPDILVIAPSFFPKSGEIEEYIYNRCLQDRERVIVLTASCVGDRVFDRIQKFAIYRWRIPKFGLTPFFNLLGSVLLAIKLYFRYRYRYIECSYGYNFVALLLLSYLLPVRFFVYVQGNEILRALRNPWVRSLLSFTLKRATGIVCDSFFIRNFLTRYFQFQTPTHVIHPVLRKEKFDDIEDPNCIENLRQKVRNSHNIPTSAVVILSVGKLQKHQGFNLVIDNLPPLLTLGLDVHYIICGQGPFEEQLRSQVRYLRLEPRVHFCKAIPEKKLAGYYAACDIFAMLSFIDYKAASIEGFSVVYLEASYFGKPIIASCLSGAVDAVRHEENGILVNPHSGSEMLTAFRRLCEDKGLREKLGHRGKALASSKSLHELLSLAESHYRCLLI
jgi:glycosyltransferase involved in cell wall biosynthesis